MAGDADFSKDTEKFYALVDFALQLNNTISLQPDEAND
jgi:hypothetical protein